MLAEGESVLVAWTETCRGPGWSNYLVNVVVRGPTGKLRTFSMQPEEWGIVRGIGDLFDVAEKASNAVTLRISAHLEEERRDRST